MRIRITQQVFYLDILLINKLLWKKRLKKESLMYFDHFCGTVYAYSVTKCYLLAS